MKSIRKEMLLGALVALSACSSTNDFFFPDATDLASQAQTSTVSATTYDAASFMSQKVESFGKEVADFKAYVDMRKNKTREFSDNANNALSEYRASVNQINARLAAGTTANNPELLDMWKGARAKLEKINDVAFDLKRYAQDIDSDVSMVDYLSDSIKAATRVGGATDEQSMKLKGLEAQVKEMGAGISLMAKSADAESEKEQAFVESEKQNLNDVALNIKNGKVYANTASGTTFGSASFADASFGAFGSSNEVKAPAKLGAKGRPIFSINFDKDVKYQEPLFQAMNRALERNPQARFDLVVVTPKRFAGKASATAERTSADVLKTLTEMGLPTTRISLATAIDNVTSEEIQVFAK